METLHIGLFSRFQVTASGMASAYLASEQQRGRAVKTSRTVCQSVQYTSIWVPCNESLSRRLPIEYYVYIHNRKQLVCRRHSSTHVHSSVNGQRSQVAEMFKKNYKYLRVTLLQAETKGNVVLKSPAVSSWTLQVLLHLG